MAQGRTMLPCSVHIAQRSLVVSSHCKVDSLLRRRLCLAQTRAKQPLPRQLRQRRRGRGHRLATKLAARGAAWGCRKSLQGSSTACLPVCPAEGYRGGCASGASTSRRTARGFCPFAGTWDNECTSRACGSLRAQRHVQRHRPSRYTVAHRQRLNGVRPFDGHYQRGRHVAGAKAAPTAPTLTCSACARPRDAALHQ